MRRTVLIPALCLLAAFALSACSPAIPGGQGPEALSPVGPGTPAFLDDMGKPLRELKAEQPSGEVGIRLDGFPDHAAACFGEPGAEYASYFFGTQSGDAEKAMDECAPQLKCAGFVTTAGVLFPDMEDEMSFEDFFSLLGVDEYEYFGDDGDTITVKRMLEDGYMTIKVQTPCLITCIKELNNPRYMSIGGILSTYSKPLTTLGYEDLKDDPLIDATTIGLKGSPTNIFKSFTPPQKGAGMMLEGADKATCEKLAGILAAKHII